MSLQDMQRVHGSVFYNINQMYILIFITVYRKAILIFT